MCAHFHQRGTYLPVLVLNLLSSSVLLHNQALSHYNDTNTTNVASTDWAAVIDAWAVRFLHEMDYRREARNAARCVQERRNIGYCIYGCCVLLALLLTIRLFLVRCSKHYALPTAGIR